MPEPIFTAQDKQDMEECNYSLMYCRVNLALNIYRFIDNIVNIGKGQK